VAEKDNKEEQLAIAERLQLKWLKRMEKLLDGGEVTSTDLATLSRFLQANGWTLDPARLPKGLRDKLTSHINPEDFDDEDGIVGRIA
jgi:hypothetical protein